MRDDHRQNWWADSVDLAGRDGAIEAGVVVRGILGSLRRIRGRIGSWIGRGIRVRIGEWIGSRFGGRTGG